VAPGMVRAVFQDLVRLDLRLVEGNVWKPTLVTQGVCRLPS
jgi:hypothetical protein